MTLEELQSMFDDESENGDGSMKEFLKFENIPKERKMHECPDICAFMILDRLVPCKRELDMVSAAEHDIIFLRPEASEVADVADRETILDLIRCGVIYDTEIDSLAMLV